MPKDALNTRKSKSPLLILILPFIPLSPAPAINTGTIFLKKAFCIVGIFPARFTNKPIKAKPKPAKRIKIIPFCLVEIFIVTLLIPINNHDRPSSISSS